MASIPSAEELGIARTRTIAKGANLAPVRAASRRGTALDLKATETTAAQEGLKKEGERIANQEFATAEVQFQIATMAEADKYKDDPDLDTIEERHAAGMTDQLGKASANITSAKARALFITRGEGAMAQANQVMSNKTTARKNDREKGHMANAMDLMIKGGMDLEYGDPGTAAEGIQLTLDSMVERNVITAVDAQQTMKKAQLDMAYGRLKQMDPKQQLAILDDPDPKTRKWVENVPPDVLRQLKDEALRQEANNRALGMAFEMGGMTEAAGLAKLQQDFINGDLDDQDYEKTRLRFQRLKNDQDTEQLQAIEDYLEEGMAEISYGGTTIKQLESTPGGIEMMKKMTEAQRNNMYAAEDAAMERAAGKGRKYSDQATVAQLREYEAKDQHVKARKYFSENSAKLNMGDFKYFNSSTSPSKSSDPNWKPTRTARQLLSEHRKENPSMSDEESSDVWDRIDVLSNDWFNDNQGKQPPPEMVNGWIEEEFIKVRHKKNWWPDEEKFLYQMDDTPGPGGAPSERQQHVDTLDFLQSATPFGRKGAGDLMSGLANENYDFVPKMTEALTVVRMRYPNEEPYQHWARIKFMLKLEPEEVQYESAGMGKQSP